MVEITISINCVGRHKQVLGGQCEFHCVRRIKYHSVVESLNSVVYDIGQTRWAGVIILVRHSIDSSIGCKLKDQDQLIKGLGRVWSNCRSYCTWSIINCVSDSCTTLSNSTWFWAYNAVDSWWTWRGWGACRWACTYSCGWCTCRSIIYRIRCDISRANNLFLWRFLLW